MDIRKFAERGLLLGLALSLFCYSVPFVSRDYVLDVAYAAWDGYMGDTDSKTVAIVDFDSHEDIAGSNGLPSRKMAADGFNYSIRWNDHLNVSDIYLRSFPAGVPTDWSQYDWLTLDIYSEKATGAQILVMPYSGGELNYFMNSFTVDWEGWNTVKFRFSQMSPTREATLKNITGVRLCANGGWGITGNSETDLYIASAGLKNELSADFTSNFYGDAAVKDVYASLEDSVAVYAGGVNFVSSDGKHTLDYDIDFSGGIVYVPERFFADFFDEDAGRLSLDSYEKNSQTYIPALEAASLLGISAFQDGRLFVAGNEDNILLFKRTANLGVNEKNEIVSQLAYNKVADVKSFTADDCAGVKKKWFEALVGNEASNDLSDPDISAKISGLTASGIAARETLIRGNPKDELFEGIVSDKSSAVTTSYTRVSSMAKAYACYGGELYRNEGLKADIIYALDWLHDNRYGTDTGWTFSGFDNWWDWEIGTPTQLMDILILMESELTDSQIRKYLDYFDELLPMPKWTGANYADEAIEVIGSALLKNDFQKVLDVQGDFQKMYLYVDDNKRISDFMMASRDFEVERKGAGFFTDGSYIFHTLHPMNGSYGALHFDVLSEFEYLFSGTKFEMNTPLRYNVPEIFFNSFAPLFAGTTMFRSVMGRTENPNNYSSGIGVLTTAFTVADSFDDETRDKIYAIVKQIYNSTDFDGVFMTNLKLNQVKKFKAVMSDEAIAGRDGHTENKVFYNMDRVVHHRDSWSLGIAMSSKRIFNYESINSNNMDGWYLGDGRTEYYLNNSTLNATSLYWSGQDPYRRPGTTVDTQIRKLASINQGNEYLSSKDFVGGVSLGGKYGVAAMDLESYHNESDFGTASGDYGGLAPAHKSDLTAKKSYFMFDDGVVCLGADIKASDNNGAEVLTIVDNLSADSTQLMSDNKGTGEPYTVIGVKASHTPEAENIAANTTDGDAQTKWAAEKDASIIWDLGESQNLGFINLSFLNGSKRKQYFELQISSDGTAWESVYDGSSSGETEGSEAYDLKNSNARYVKFINKGNSGGSAWVSLTECAIYPPNPDGSIGFAEADIFGIDKFVADGRQINLLGDDYDLGNITWAHMDGKCGYYFPADGSTNAGKLKARWTRGSDSHFELWYSHGVNPSGGSYAYMLLPGADAEFTGKYAENPGIRVLANNGDIQAVKDLRSNTTGIVFRKESSFEGITVNKPCIVMFKDSETAFDIAVSDPTQKLTSLTVKINRTLSLTEKDEDIESETDGGLTTIKMNTTGSGGRTFEASYTK